MRGMQNNSSEYQYITYMSHSDIVVVEVLPAFLVNRQISAQYRTITTRLS